MASGRKCFNNLLLFATVIEKGGGGGRGRGAAGAGEDESECRRLTCLNAELSDISSSMELLFRQLLGLHF